MFYAHNTQMKSFMESKAGQVSIGVMITLFLVLIIGVSLTPTVASLTTRITGENITGSTTNLTGTSQTVYSLVSLFWIIFIVGIVAVAGYAQYKKM